MMRSFSIGLLGVGELSESRVTSEGSRSAMIKEGQLEQAGSTNVSNQTSENSSSISKILTLSIVVIVSLVASNASTGGKMSDNRTDLDLFIPDVFDALELSDFAMMTGEGLSGVIGASNPK